MCLQMYLFHFKHVYTFGLMIVLKESNVHHSICILISVLFYEERIEFYIDETEMMHPRSEPGIYFSVHSPFENVNPLKTGIFLEGGRTYRLYVEMVSSHSSYLGKTRRQFLKTQYSKLLFL